MTLRCQEMGTFTRNVTIGGTLTYEDVTNIDSVGLVTARTGIEIGARPGVAASISVDGNMIVSGISTFGGDVQVSDKIIHSGDTNTAITDSLLLIQLQQKLVVVKDFAVGSGNVMFKWW